MRCVICGLPGEAPFLLAGGRNLGTTCGADRCGALLWESAICPGETKDERDFLAWRVRKQVAERNGRPFSVPSPSAAQLRELEAHLQLAAMAGGESQ